MVHRRSYAAGSTAAPESTACRAGSFARLALVAVRLAQLGLGRGSTSRAAPKSDPATRMSGTAITGFRSRLIMQGSSASRSTRTSPRSWSRRPHAGLHTWAARRAIRISAIDPGGHWGGLTQPLDRRSGRRASLGPFRVQACGIVRDFRLETEAQVHAIGQLGLGLLSPRH